METQDLYNLSPTIRLMIVGIIVAVGPLAWVWLKNRHAPPAQRLRTLTWVTLFLTFDLVIFGAFTRLTDSGLGCPDWPGCYGHVSPVGAIEQINAAQAAMPSGPVTLAIASWLERRRNKQRGAKPPLGALTPLEDGELRAVNKLGGRISPWWPTFTLFWVCLQGAFGALTVTMKLFPAIVTLHLLGGMILLALLKVQNVRYAQAEGELLPVPMQGATRAWIVVTFALLWLQIALGGWVSTNYAVLACTDFPACQNSLWPAMNFREAFTLWRELGAGRNGENISFQALTAIHYVHRLTAYVVFAAMLVVVVKLYKVAALRSASLWLAGLAFLQVATGLANVLFGWPLAAAVMHTGGAAALVVVLTGMLCSSRIAESVESGEIGIKAKAAKLSPARSPA